MNARQLRGVIDTTADAVAAGHEQDRLLRGLALRVIGDVRNLIALNDVQVAKAREIAGTLDALDQASHEPLRSELSIRALVRRLRADLDTIAATDADGTEYALAATRVREVCEQAPSEKLLSRTLRHELGGRRHDLLVEVVRSVER